MASVQVVDHHFDDTATSSGVAQAPQADRTKRVPSKNVRLKKKDAHKKLLNEKTMQNKVNPRLDAKRFFAEEDLAIVLEECRRTAMQQPPREFDVSIEGTSLTNVCAETVNYLSIVGKVLPRDGDAENLAKVVKAQAITKINLARRHNGKTVNVAELEYSNRVEKRFNVLPKILNVYLEQIGFCTVDGQTFIPKKKVAPSFETLGPGRYLTTLRRNSPQGELMGIATIAQAHLASYVENGVFVNEHLFVDNLNTHGTIEWVPTSSVGNFQSLCTWYEDFINRCSKRVASVLEHVTYGKGEGSVAQLVGSRDDERIQQREVWCNKLIDQNTLQIGGLFGYGYMSTDKFHDEDIATLSDRIDIEGMYQRIQRCQKL